MNYRAALLSEDAAARLMKQNKTAAEGATLYVPLDAADPLATALANSVTVTPLSALPLNVGMLTLVMLSVLLAPLSEAANRSGTLGAAGATVSIVTLSAVDALE